MLNTEGIDEIKKLTNYLCIIVFGNYQKESYAIFEKYPNVKIVDAELYFDEEFATQFVEWFKNYEHRGEIFMDFVDMTHSDSKQKNDSIKIIKNKIDDNTIKPNILRISTIKYGIDSTIDYYVGDIKIDQTHINTSRFLRVVMALYSPKGGYYNKYIKYKLKYINLKNKINL